MIKYTNDDVADAIRQLIQIFDDIENFKIPLDEMDREFSISDDIENNIIYDEKIIWIDGQIEYWQKGKLHREKGPAFKETNGTKHWYQNGQLHRLDGPAIEILYNGGEYYWYIEGKKYTEEEYIRRIKNKLFW